MSRWRGEARSLQASACGCTLEAVQAKNTALMHMVTSDSAWPSAGVCLAAANQPPPPPLPRHSFDDVKKEACFILGLLAVKPEYQAAIASAGALGGLVKLLRAHKPTAVTKVVPGSGGVARRAADAVTNLAHENVEIKVRGAAAGMCHRLWTRCIAAAATPFLQQPHGIS